MLGRTLQRELARVFGAAAEPLDTMRPSMSVVRRRLLGVAVEHNLVPLVHMHVQCSCGSDAEKRNSRQGTVVTQLRAKNVTMPLRIGRSSSGWVCGVHADIGVMGRCLRQRYGVTPDHGAYAFLLVFREPLERLRAEHSHCCEANAQCWGRKCTAGSFEEFALATNDTHHMRQLWMTSGLKQHECWMQESDYI